MKKILLDYKPEEIKEILVSKGMQKFRATQIYEWLTSYTEFSEMTNIKKEERDMLNDEYIACPIKIEKVFSSKDGTKKFLYKLNDGDLVEGSLLKYKYGYTLCVSSQIGCRMGCKFCASGLDGLIRNLTTGEILGQVLAVNKFLGGSFTDRKITNIVLMGSGEPLDNYDNVVKFIEIVMSNKSLNISPRKISLSTSGLVDKIYKLTDLDLKLTLTLSLHATDDVTRKQIMRVANAYSLKDTFDALKYYYEKSKRRIVFEYILLDINTTDQDVKRMKEISKLFDCHFNLIPFNKVPESKLNGITKEKQKVFFDKLKSAGISVTVRRTLGEDIEGACGQLRRRVLKSGD